MSESEIQGKEQNELTEQQKKTKDLVFQSFRFSQGGPELQEDILKWLIVKGHFTDIELPATIPEYITEKLIPKKHEVLEEEEITPELRKMWSKLLYANSSEKQFLSEEKLLPLILFNTIKRDKVYQERERPNRQPSEQITPDSINDPHASFIRKYILNAHPTGNTAFDKRQNRNEKINKYIAEENVQVIRMIFMPDSKKILNDLNINREKNRLEFYEMRGFLKRVLQNQYECESEIEQEKRAISKDKTRFR